MNLRFIIGVCPEYFLFKCPYNIPLINFSVPGSSPLHIAKLKNGHFPLRGGENQKVRFEVIEFSGLSYKWCARLEF